MKKLSIYFTSENLDILIKWYIYFTLFMAFGIIFQVYSFFILGQEIGKVHVFFYGRIAFSFIWMDFSFLSLYFISSIPLLFLVYRKNIAIVLSLLLMVSSVITSARTGIFAFSVVLILIVLKIIFFDLLIKYKIKKYYSYFLILIPLIFYGIYLMINTIMNREMSVSGSGRLDGYMEGIYYWLDNILFGTCMNPDVYRELIGATPHNLFIYMLSIGGVLLFIPFLIWLLLIHKKTFQVNFYTMLSILISLIGFNLIPSFFSAYYFAFLLSIMFFSYNTDKNMKLIK